MIDITQEIVLNFLVFLGSDGPPFPSIDATCVTGMHSDLIMVSRFPGDTPMVAAVEIVCLEAFQESRAFPSESKSPKLEFVPWCTFLRAF